MQRPRPGAAFHLPPTWEATPAPRPHLRPPPSPLRVPCSQFRALRGPEGRPTPKARTYLRPWRAPPRRTAGTRPAVPAASPRPSRGETGSGRELPPPPPAPAPWQHLFPVRTPGSQNLWSDWRPRLGVPSTSPRPAPPSPVKAQCPLPSPLGPTKRPTGDSCGSAFYF